VFERKPKAGMPRIFLSHSSRDNRQAIALRQWLIDQNPPLDNEIFLDLHRDSGIRAGVRWKDALRQASTRCEAVICLLSPHWEASSECRTEYRFAEYLNKRIFSARIGSLSGEDPTREWQQIDLVGEGPTTEVDINDGGAPVHFLSEGLHRLREGIVGAGTGADTFAWPPLNDPNRAPYRGWESLEEADAAVFFGRDAQILRGLDELRGMRRSGLETLFVVLGPSGTGKSSFLRAGLLPRLRRNDREFTVLDIVRPQRNVLTGDTGFARAIHGTRRRLGLARPQLGSIKQACVGGDAQTIRQLLVEMQQAASARLLTEAGQTPLPTLVLPLDQAEELFGADAGAEGSTFLELISALAAGDESRDQAARLGLVVALTIRTDRYQALQTASPLAAVDTVVFDELKPMPRTQFLQVITGPAARSSEGGRPLQLEPQLIQRLLDDCTEGADTLPLLALTLARLYEDYAGQSTTEAQSALTVADYESMGGMQSVVRTEIDRQLATDPAERSTQLQLLRSAFIPWLATVNPDSDQPMRRVAHWDDLPEKSRPLLERFVARRLLIKDERDGAVVVEVALESLLRQWDDLAAWLAEQREDLKDADALERAAAAWANHPDDAWLLQGTRLVDAEALAVKPGFRGRLRPVGDYLRASRQREDERTEREEKRREAELQAARKLAAAETSAKEHAEARANEAQTHAVVLRRRSRVLRIVLVAALIVAAAAVGGFVTATKATRQADQRTREAVALRLTSEGDGMLAGVDGGGDERAIQQILAAPRIAPTADVGAEFTGVVERQDTLKIIKTPGPVLAVAVSPHGHRVVSGGYDHTLRLFNADTGQPIGQPLTGNTDVVETVAFSPDGHRIASGGDDHTVRLWNADTGQPIGAPMIGHDGIVGGVAFSPDGHRIASASSDHTVRLWNADTGQPIGAPLAGHTNWVNSVAFSPDGHRIVSASDDQTLRLWNADTGQPIGAPLTGHTNWVTGVAFSPDGHRIVSCSEDGTVRLWSADTGQPIGRPLTGHTGAPASVAFGPDGHRVISGGLDDTVRVWNTDTGQEVGGPLTGHTSWVSSVAFSADGGRIVSGSEDDTVRVWNDDAVAPLTGHTDVVTSVAFSPDGHRIVSGSYDHTVRLWNTDTRQPIGQPLTGHTDVVTSVAFSPDGHRIVSGSWDRTVRLWNADTGQPIGPPMTGHSDQVSSVAFSPDGHRIVSASYDQTLRLWNADTGQPIGQPLTGHTDVVTSVAFSPDGHRIVSGSYDRTVRLWNADTGQPIGAPMTGHTYAVRAVAFSPDGHRVVSGSQDATLRLWNADTGQPIGQPLTGHTGTVRSLAYSPRGHRIVSASDDQTLRLWNADTGESIGRPLTGHTNAVLAAAFSPDKNTVASGSSDRTVQVWSAPLQEQWPALLCSKLSANMSHKEWNEWVSRDITYTKVCPDLPVAPDNPG
jgi:WD40 repeat protein